MTKTEAKKLAREIESKLEEILILVENLKYEIEATLEDIEPYENKEELTTSQEDRVEWFEDLNEILDIVENDVDEALSNINGY